MKIFSKCLLFDQGLGVNINIKLQIIFTKTFIILLYDLIKINPFKIVHYKNYIKLNLPLDKIST